jgi:hypothetical protein
VYGDIFAYAPVYVKRYVFYAARGKLTLKVRTVLLAKHNKSRALHAVFVKSARDINALSANVAAVASHIVFALGQKLFHTAVDIESRIQRKRKNFHFYSPLQIILYLLYLFYRISRLKSTAFAEKYSAFAISPRKNAAFSRRI